MRMYIYVYISLSATSFIGRYLGPLGMAVGGRAFD